MDYHEPQIIEGRRVSGVCICSVIFIYSNYTSVSTSYYRYLLYCITVPFCVPHSLNEKAAKYYHFFDSMFCDSQH